MTEPVRINPGYALGQLARAMETSRRSQDPAVRARAAAKIERWTQVLSGMESGSIAVGSRTPVAGAPAWATLEVVTGGFATGNLLAGGPPQPHETELFARLSASPAGGGANQTATLRTALNLHALSDEGRAALQAMLQNGCYRIEVPEEGALLVVAWLLEKGHTGPAEDILDAIVPFFDRLRFYPVPASLPLVPSAFVRVRTASETARALGEVQPRPQIARMNEALTVWAPLLDRAVLLFLETVEGPAPRYVKAGNDVAKGPGGNPRIEGGWPCKHYPGDWAVRAAKLVDDYRSLRREHNLCGKPENPKESLAILRHYLERCAADPAALRGHDVGKIRGVLAAIVTRRGVPGSPAHQELRAEQARVAGLPSRPQIAAVLAARLDGYPKDAGLPSLDPVKQPVSDSEARSGAPAGTAIPESLKKKLQRCLEAPIEQLVQERILRSSEMLALVLPQITSQLRASGIDDPALSRLYAAIYTAFRRRRSLLLVDLAHQVRLEELPWVAAISAYRKSDLDARERARQSLSQVVTLALQAFPQTILPNMLLRELGALIKDAELDLPLTEEIAADIFMGDFSAKYLKAAQMAGLTLRGSLYERYYGIPYERVLGLKSPEKNADEPPPPGFTALCEERAGERGAALSSVSWNGKVLEQQQILTTHNLAQLVEGLHLAPALRARLFELSQTCFKHLCKQLQIKSGDWKVNLRRIKNSAYSFRQMVFLLSFLSPAELSAFLEWATGKLLDEPAAFRERFQPALDGLVAVARGQRFDEQGKLGSARRFLGWTTEKHWIRPPQEPAVPG